MVLLSKETCSCVFPKFSINSSPLLQFSYSSSVRPQFNFPSVILPFMHMHLSKRSAQTSSAPVLSPLSAFPAISQRAVEQFSLSPLDFHADFHPAPYPCSRMLWAASLHSPICSAAAPSPCWNVTCTWEIVKHHKIRFRNPNTWDTLSF